MILGTQTSIQARNCSRCRQRICQNVRRLFIRMSLTVINLRLFIKGKGFLDVHKLSLAVLVILGLWTYLRQ